jgi:F0F1-type ATP synthase membrane subunit c/vacuolar-type H+-ATPase subunit K
MTPHRILQINALATAASAVALLAGRGILPRFFGLSSPLLLDIVAVGFLIYAGALALAAARRPVQRQALIAFAIADAAWVVGSAVALLMFWPQLEPLGRILIVAVALVVEVFATLQYRAADAIKREYAQPA